MREFNIPMTIANGRDKAESDLYEANNRINDLLDIVKQKDEAIKILLTAFEKEKETSHYIQSQLDIANAKLIEEKEMNAVQRKMLNDAFDRGWIHKDKIKELQNNYVGQYLKFYEKIQELLEEE